MIVVISGLPKQFSYQDVKATIKQETALKDFIVDNFTTEANGTKRVTVGLADVSDVPVFINRLNGLIINGHRLNVEPLGSTQYPTRSSGNGPGHGYDPPSQGYQTPVYGKYKSYASGEPPHWQGPAPRPHPQEEPRGRDRLYESKIDNGRRYSPPLKRGRSLERRGQEYSPTRKSTRQYSRSPPRKITPWEQGRSDSNWIEPRGPARAVVAPLGPLDRSGGRSSPIWRNDTPREFSSRSPLRDARPQGSYGKFENSKDYDSDPYFEYRGSKIPARSSGTPFHDLEIPLRSSGQPFRSEGWAPEKPPIQETSNRHPRAMSPQMRSSGPINFSGLDPGRPYEKPKGPPVQEERGRYGYSTSQWDPPPQANVPKPNFGRPIESRIFSRDEKQPNFGSGGAPQPFRPREERPTFGHRDDHNFLLRDGAHFDPRDTPQRFAPLEATQRFEPRVGPHFGKLDQPQREIPPHFGPRDDQFPPRGPAQFGHREEPHFEPRRDFVPRDVSNFLPQGAVQQGQFFNRDEPRLDQWDRRDQPHNLQEREFKSLHKDTNYMAKARVDIPKDLGPHEQFNRERAPDKFGPRDLKPFESREFRHEKNGNRGHPDIRHPPVKKNPEFERRGRELSPRDRSRSGNRNSRPSEHPQALVRSQDDSEKEMELRDLVVGRISGQLLSKYFKDMPEQSQLFTDVEYELRKVILDRIDSIFGIEFGHTFAQISDGYKLHHKETGDKDLMLKLTAKCTAKNYVSKKPNAGLSSPSHTKVREVDARSHPRASNFKSSTGVPSYPYGGGDDLKQCDQSTANKTSNVEINEDTLKHKLYIIKDDFKTITALEGVAIKEFLVDEIIRAADNSDFTPSFTLNGIQNMISFEVIAENEKSRTWLINHSLSGFKLFNILVYRFEELTYERACILLPGHTNLPLQPLEKLKLQNKNLNGVNLDKWKMVKSITMKDGTRVFFDIDKESSLKLVNFDMTLNYELEKVFVVLACMATDKGEFEKVFYEPSVPINSFSVYLPDIDNFPTKLTKNTIRMSLDEEEITQDTCKRLKYMVLTRMFEDLMNNGINIKIANHGMSQESKFLAFTPENEESSEWLLSLNLELDGKKVLIEKGLYYPKYLRVGAILPGELGLYGPSVLQNLESYNNINGVDFKKWRLVAQMVNSNCSGSKVAMDADFQSVLALRQLKYCLKYNSKVVTLKHNHHTLLSSYVQQMQEGVEDYDNHDMDIDQDNSDKEDFNCIDDKNIENAETLETASVAVIDNEKNTVNKTEKVTDDPVISNVIENAIGGHDKITENDDTATAVNYKNDKQNEDNAQETPNDTDRNEVDDDVIICVTKQHIITIDSEEEDDEYSDVKKNLEGIFKAISREIEKRQQKDPLGRDLSLRSKYETSTDVHEWKFNGKFADMSNNNLRHYHDRLVKCKIPSREVYHTDRSVLDHTIELLRVIKDKINML